MNNGWVKLPRSLLESCVLRQPEILQVFIYALLQARFKETVVSVKGHTVALEAGQCIFSRITWAYESHISEIKAYRALRKLEEYGLIKIKATTKYTVVSIQLVLTTGYMGFVKAISNLLICFMTEAITKIIHFYLNHM